MNKNFSNIGALGMMKSFQGVETAGVVTGLKKVPSVLYFLYNSNFTKKTKIGSSGVMLTKKRIAKM